MAKQEHEKARDICYQRIACIGQTTSDDRHMNLVAGFHPVAGARFGIPGKPYRQAFRAVRRRSTLCL